MVFVENPYKERIDTKVVYKKSAGYKRQLEEGIEESIKEDLGI